MRIGIPRETKPGERRVAATPESVAQLRRLGFSVAVETGAGLGAGYDDDEYRAAGADVADGPEALFAEAELVLKVQPPGWNTSLGRAEADMLREGSTLVSFLWPAQNQALLDRLRERRATVLAMDLIPRISRAQKYDALSSMANIAGYRGVIEAAACFGSFFTGQMTAAGKVPPAIVLVIGAGVAGLSAIGAARGLGAVVRAFDTRPEVGDQVRSMGAEFLEVTLQEDGAGAGGYARVMSPAFLEAERKLFLEQAREVDIIITTALIPGKPAPRLLSQEMVEAMRVGSVIVDLAAEAGGNCELTRPGAATVTHGVTILGYVDLPSRLARTASQLYASNLSHLIRDLGGSQSWHLDLSDAVVRSALVMENGQQPALPPSEASAPQAPPPVPEQKPASAPMPMPAAPKAVVPWRGKLGAIGIALAGTLLLGGLGAVAPPEFVSRLTVFVLAVFVGWQVVWNVTPSLHTPLMSVTNAISGIIVLGGVIKLGGGAPPSVLAVSTAAILLAAINIVGGFVVTQRMLRMFRR